MRRFIAQFLNPPMAVALVALFVALGGASYAAVAIPRASVGTAQLKANAVVSSKVRNHSLLAADFRRGQIPRGPRGFTGPRGAPGLSGVEIVTGSTQSGTGGHTVTVSCPSGKRAVAGGYMTSGISGSPTITITNNAVQDGGASWEVSGRLSNSSSWSLTARAVCASAS